jgi:hypothetical protein
VSSDPYRDEPRTRAKQILAIFEADRELWTSKVIPITTKIKEPNPGWENLEKYNRKRMAEKKRREEEDERLAA